MDPLIHLIAAESSTGAESSALLDGPFGGRDAGHVPRLLCCGAVNPAQPKAGNWILPSLISRRRSFSEAFVLSNMLMPIPRRLSFPDRLSAPNRPPDQLDDHRRASVGTAREPERQQREKTARTTASNPRKYLILLTLRLGKGRIPFPSLSVQQGFHGRCVPFREVPPYKLAPALVASLNVSNTCSKRTATLP